jgi:dTDP-4-dehydrorhamnose 3,5-epimerase
MTVREISLPGVLILEPDVYEDERGFFLETYRAERYREAGVPMSFVQDNLSRSQEDVLRGLHFQQDPHAQGKLITVLRGAVHDIVVDVREGSPTFKQWEGIPLSADRMRQLWVPEGFAHGFVVTDGPALFHYKCTDVYNREAERAIRWDDPDLAIDWPVESPRLSDKDRAAPRLQDLPRRCFRFETPAPAE